MGRMTWQRTVAYAVVVVVVVVVVLYLSRVFTLGNEPPIRVKNGSIEVEVTAGNWKENDDDGSHSPDNGSHPDLFWVKVTGQGASTDCADGLKASGKMVDVSYSGGGGVFFRAATTTLSKHTRVSSFGGDLEANAQYLRYDKGGVGYISEIVVRGGGPRRKCTLNQKYDALEIYICSSPDAAKCK